MVNTALILPDLLLTPLRLVAHGQRDKALKFLARLHSRDSDVDSPVVQLMIQEIEAAIHVDGADQRLWSFGQVFRGRANLIRWGMGTIITVWGQLSGQGAVNCEQDVERHPTLTPRRLLRWSSRGRRNHQWESATGAQPGQLRNQFRLRHRWVVGRGPIWTSIHVFLGRGCCHLQFGHHRGVSFTCWPKFDNQSECRN